MIDVYKFLKKFTKVELLYLSSMGTKYTFKSEITDILDDKILISYPKKDIENFEKIELLSKLTAVFCTEDGVLSGNINLIKKNIGESVLISFPYNNQFCQRRENTRIPMHVDVELTWSNEIIELKTKNISGKGIACLTDAPLPDLDNANLVIHMPTKDVSVLCKKVYSKIVDYGESKTVLNGITFTEIADEDVNIIVKDCLKFQLESKHNEKLFETL